MIFRNGKLKIQKTFSDKERITCKNLFSLHDDENLMFVWWINPLNKQAFIFTDKRVLWNIPTKISGENDIECYHRDDGEILYSEKSFLELTADENEITIHTKEKRYSFKLIHLFSVHFEQIEDIFKNYFEERKAPDDENCHFKNSFILGIERFFQKISIAENEDVIIHDNTKKLKLKNTALKTASAIRHSIDFILDVYSFLILSLCYSINSTINNPIIKNIYDGIKDLPKRSDFLLIMLIICLLYLILKTFIIFTTKKVKKLPLFILIIIQILVWLIANDKFAFLVLINFLVIFIFQSLCNFSKTSIRLKFTLYFAILIAAYLSITYIR